MFKHTQGGGGASTPSGPSSLEEEQKKVVLFEDNVKAKDEELQKLRQEKVALERELADEKVAKNHLYSENMSLAAELQKIPDHTALTAQISENEKDLQHFKSQVESLQRKVQQLEQERDRAVQLSYRHTNLGCSAAPTSWDARTKQSSQDFEKTVREKEEMVYKLEQDLRESREENEREMVVNFVHEMEVILN